MKWFSNMKIGVRLILSFAIILAGLLAISVFSSISTTSLVSADQSMYTQNLQGVSGVGDAVEAFYALRVTVLKTVYENFTAAGADALATTLTDTKATIDTMTNKYKGAIIDKTDEDNLKALTDDFNAYFTEVDKVVAGIKANDKDTTIKQMSIMAGYAKTVSDQLNVMQKYNNDQASHKANGNKSLGGSTTTVVMLISIIVFLLTIVLAILVTGSITKPVTKMLGIANKLAIGDTNIILDVDTKDEIGLLAKSLNHVVEALKRMIADANMLAAAAVEGKLSTRADVSAHEGDYRKIVKGVNLTLDSIIVPVNESIAVMRRLSVNDYTTTVTGQYKGDMNILSTAINDTIARLLSVQQTFINLAVGDISLLEKYEKIVRRSENDIMMPSAAKVMRTLKSLIDDANQISVEAARGNLNIRGDASKYEGMYSVMIQGINSTIEAMAMPMNEAIGVLEHMAQNDLTYSMDGQYHGAFENFAQSINTVIETLSSTLSEINVSAEQVASGTQQVSSGSQALSQGATEQASSIEELTASLSEIAGQTRQNAINAGQASDLAQAARDSAADGKVQMSELQQAMTAINESSANISKIIKVIDEIAFQTNLLALNAAVEAARAGQHGKGFAVVAEEVRNLAQRSANAAKETTEMIEGSIKKVQAGTQIANDTATALVKIVGSVEKATELVGGIAKASNDQAMAVAQVNTGIEQVSQVTQTNSATAEESAAASEELSSQAALLKEMVGRFSLRGQAHISGQKASFQPQAPTRSLGAGKPAGKPKITLNDREFGKY